MVEDYRKNYYMKFGQHLQQLLKKYDVDVVTVASFSNIEQKQIYRTLNGEHGPSMKTILSISQGLNIHPKELFDFDFETSDDLDSANNLIK